MDNGESRKLQCVVVRINNGPSLYLYFSTFELANAIAKELVSKSTGAPTIIHCLDVYGRATQHIYVGNLDIGYCEIKEVEATKLDKSSVIRFD